jgi:GWxTD domain-containing protein
MASLALATGAIAESKLPLVVDIASYRIAPGQDSSYVEVYYGVARDSLHFISSGDTMWQAYFVTEIKVTDTLGQRVDSLTKLVETRASSEAETRQRDVKVFDVTYFYLLPGDYVITLRLTDVETKTKGEWKDTVHVLALGRTDSLALSDLELAYRIQPAGDTVASPMVKNGYLVVPNPSGLYAPEDSLLSFYAELYNIKPEPETFQVHIWVLNTSGDVVKDLGVQEAKRPGENALLNYAVRIDNLDPGARYTLALEVDHGSYSTNARKAFWLGTGVTTPQTFEKEEFAEEDATFNRQFLAYIATADELKEYNALGLEGKRNFLYDFWRRHDPTPGTPQNEFYQEHARRFAIANDRFSRSGARHDDGWNSARGRIFILYGPPDDIIQSASSLSSQPWERWEYRQLEGGSFFIFLDEKGLGVYRLVHSNKQGEFQDPDWEQKMEREGSDIFR